MLAAARPRLASATCARLSSVPVDRSRRGHAPAECRRDGYGHDLSDPGDDLLGEARRGVVPDGTETTPGWRVPDGQIGYGWNADGTPQEQAEAVAGPDPDAVIEAEVSRTTVLDVAGQETWATTATAPDGASIRASYSTATTRGAATR